jgi:hypothetical protein
MGVMSVDAVILSLTGLNISAAAPPQAELPNRRTAAQNTAERVAAIPFAHRPPAVGCATDAMRAPVHSHALRVDLDATHAPRKIQTKIE